MSRQLGLQLDPIMNTGGSQFPVKRGTWDFIEDAWNEGIAESIKTQIGFGYNSGTVYILYGCILTTSMSSTNISSGALFYNGEIFKTTGAIFANPTGGDVVVCNLVSTPFTPTDAVGNFYADPVTFIGIGGTADIHINRTATFAAGASGSGTISGTTASDFGNLVNAIPQYTSTGIVWSNVGAGTWADTGSPFFPAGYKIQGNTVSLCGGATSSSVQAGGSPIMTLPVGARPSSEISLICFANGAGGTTGLGELTIAPSGLVTLANTSTTANGSVSFDGVSFRIN